jgi:hypothetical protein
VTLLGNVQSSGSFNWIEVMVQELADLKIQLRGPRKEVMKSFGTSRHRAVIFSNISSDQALIFVAGASATLPR